MADTLRVVTVDGGGRVVPLLDLNSASGSATGYFRDRDAGFTFTPGVSTQQNSSRSRRYGGSLSVGETHDNGAIAWTAYVKGNTLAQATANVETLLRVMNSAAVGRMVEWAPEGGLSTFFVIMGPGTWSPAYNPVEFVQTNSMRVAITFPTEPLGLWAPCTIRDRFAYDDILDDYVFDAGTPEHTLVSNGTLVDAGSTSTEYRRLRHTARGYTWREGQALLSFTTPPVMNASWKAGIAMRIVSAVTFIELYADYTGAGPGAIKIDVVTNNVRVNRATVNILSGIPANTTCWLLAQASQDGFILSFWKTGLPTPVTTYAATGGTGYTLSPTEKVAMPEGGIGFSWEPGSTGGKINYFEFCPFVSANQFLPFDPAGFVPTYSWFGNEIPGTAPAKADLLITSQTADDPPAFMLVSWAQTDFGINRVPFGLLIAEDSAINGRTLSGLTSTSDANAFRGSVAEVNVSGATTVHATWNVTPSLLSPDDFTQHDLILEVWAGLKLNPGLVNPTMMLSAKPTVASYGATVYTDEYGTEGSPVVTPSSGDVYRLTRIGTITLFCDPVEPSGVILDLQGSVGAGSTGNFGINYIICVPIRQRALGPTAKSTQGGVYPSWVRTNNEITKKLTWDLAGITYNSALSRPWPAGQRDTGLGGTLIEPPPGLVQWFIKPSNLVPDNPDSTTGSDQASYSGCLQVDVVPRSFLLRTP